MRILGTSIPVFLGNAGIGANFGQIAPQIMFFDVFYESAPAVGFQVIGGP